MDIELSVVVPVHNEQDNVVPLIEETVAALQGGVAHELIFVDDFSKDNTLEVLKQARSRFPNLRVVAHGQNCGQSSAIRTGVRAARAA